MTYSREPDLEEQSRSSEPQHRVGCIIKLKHQSKRNLDFGFISFLLKFDYEDDFHFKNILFLPNNDNVNKHIRKLGKEHKMKVTENGNKENNKRKNK